MKPIYIIWEYDDYTKQRCFVGTCPTEDEAISQSISLKAEDPNYIYEIEKINVSDVVHRRMS